MKEQYIKFKERRFVQDPEVAKAMAYAGDEFGSRSHAAYLRNMPIKSRGIRYLKDRFSNLDKAHFLDGHADRLEEKAKFYFQAFQEFKKPKLQHFLDNTVSRATESGQTIAAHALTGIMEKDPHELLDLYNSAMWKDDSLFPSVVKSVVEIGIVAAADTKSKTKVLLSGSTDSVDWNPLALAIRGNDYANQQGLSEPDMHVPRNLMTLLGREDVLPNLPTDMPGFSRFLGRNIFVDIDLPNPGVSLLITYNGAREQEAFDHDLSGDVYAIHGHIDLKIRKLQPRQK
jgi:hypothetical protein